MRLSWPIATDSPASALNSSKPSSDAPEQTSASSTAISTSSHNSSSPTTSCPSYRFLRVNATESGATVQFQKVLKTATIAHHKKLRAAEVKKRESSLQVDSKTAKSNVDEDQEFKAWLKTQAVDQYTLNPRASCRKLRMFPTADQRKILDRWVLGCKKTWNMATDLVNKKKIDPVAQDMDQRIVTKAGLQKPGLGLGRSAAHALCVPAQIRKKVTRRLEANYKAAATNAKGNRFRMHPVRYDDMGDGAFEVEHQYTQLNLSERWVRFHMSDVPKASKGGVLFPGRIKIQKQSRKDKRPIAPAAHDMVVIKRNGRYFLCVPRFDKVPNVGIMAPDDHVINEHSVIALDPGVRVFLTGWCPGTGVVTEFGRQEELEARLRRAKDRERGVNARMADMAGIATKVCQKFPNASADELKRQYGRRMRNLRSRRHKHAARQENIIHDFHEQTASSLLRQYRHVILPRFSSKGINRLNVSEGLKQYAKQLNHFKFRERLLQKTWRHPGSVVWLCGEHYTTMMCGRCGENNRNVGASKVFKCPTCAATAPRDAHAARNIYLKIGFGTPQ